MSSSSPVATGSTAVTSSTDGGGGAGGRGSTVGPRSTASVFLPPSNTRLVTIAAHVDHGKTTLADNLIEHNGLISERLAGTLRYLDFDPEEQRRGITIRSAAIGLKHSYVPSPAAAAAANKNKQNLNQHQQPQNTPGPGAAAPSDQPDRNYIIHLLDSPGHTDFSMEVSSSLLACDGALLVIDVVEGMGARTHQVLREAHVHQLVPVLVMNKVDRLHTDLALTPTEAYVRLRTLLETVNAAAAAMLTSARYDDSPDEKDGRNNDGDASKFIDQTRRKRKGRKQNRKLDATKTERDEKEDQMWTFDPAKGNVVFASALFGWGFTVQSLARSLFRSKQVPIKPVALKQYLFGDYKIRDDKVLKWRHGGEEEPIFAQYALEPIFAIYQGVETACATIGIGTSSASTSSTSFGAGKDASKENKATTKDAGKIRSDLPGMDQVLDAMTRGATATSSNAIPRTTQEMEDILNRQGANTPEAVLRTLLRRYRPLAPTVLDTVCEIFPSPKEAARTHRSRALALQKPSITRGTESGGESTSEVRIEEKVDESFARIRLAVEVCDVSRNAPSVAHVCNFMTTDKVHVRDPDLLGSIPEQEENLMFGLARVLSGRLRTGNAYFLMDEVPAGHLCAVYGLDNIPFKTVTLCDRPGGMPLVGFPSGIKPLVKVGIEPEQTKDMDALERGLAKLSLVDSAVEVSVTEKGERIIACLGEIHLEQSLLDLENLYCGKPPIKLRKSDPIIDFAETTDWFDKHELDFEAFARDTTTPPLRQTIIPPYNEEEGLGNARLGRARVPLSGRSSALHVRAVPLASSIHESLEQEEVIEGAEDDLLYLGRALGYIREDGNPEVNSLTATEVLGLLSESLCFLGTNGNALIESRGLRDGSCVVGVKASEVYLPTTLVENEEHEKVDDAVEEKQGEALSPDKVDHQRLRARIISSEYQRGGPTKDLSNAADIAAFDLWTRQMRGSAVAGFQLAMSSGAICEEPVRHVLVILEGVEVAVTQSDDENEHTSYQASKPLSGGMVVSAIRSGVRCALLTRPARLMEGHLRLTLHTSLTGLGSLYTVLSRRRGKVLEDTMVDGTDLLMINALIPQAESFGLAPELYRRTKGEVTAPELVFSHWERLDVDPFWIPTSQEEREDFGETQTTGDTSTGVDNTALHYIRKVRKRKGLLVDSRVTVMGAEKQRTLKR